MYTEKLHLHLISLWYHDITVDECLELVSDFTDASTIDLKLVLLEVWHRGMSADDALDILE